MDLGLLQGWSVSDWITLLGVIGALASIVGLPLAYLAIRKPRWRKYRCRGLPYRTIFRSGDYGYDQKTFLKDIRSVDLALEELRTWYGDCRPLLLKGAAGIGKSRLVTEFIYGLSIWRRIYVRVLMPTPHEMNIRFPPFFKRGCILFLDDLHEFRYRVDDSKLEHYVKSDGLKVIATIPAEKYDSSWELLSRFTWREILVENWTPQEGRRLAHTKGMEFAPNEFKGTPLSVLAPDTQLKRSYDLLSPGGKAVLRALKIVKTHLGCYADYDLISALQSSGSKFGHEDFLEIISKGFWCKTDDSKCMLADGIEDFVQYNVSMSDAFVLQLVLMGGK